MPFPTARAWLALLGATAIGAAPAVAILLAVGHPGQVKIALGTAGVCLLASLAALEPVRWAGRVSMIHTPPAALAGIGIRLAVSLGGAAGLIFGLGFEQKPTVLWTLGFYLLLLVVEVRLLVGYFQSMLPRNPPQTSDGPDPSAPNQPAVEGR